MQKILPILVCAAASAAFGASCESLASLALPDAAITLARVVPAGQFTQPGAQGEGQRRERVQGPSRISAAWRRRSSPPADSDIKIEVWLPVAGWNRKFQAVGNGGWAGVISYSALADAVQSGYATVPPIPATSAAAAVSRWDIPKS